MEKTLESRTVYRGSIINLRLDSVELGNGRTALREVVEHPGAVGILALKKNGDIVMVRQYRKAVERKSFGTAGGQAGKGEDSGVRCKELEEETGTGPRYPLHNDLYVPGFSNEVISTLCYWPWRVRNT